MALLRSLKLSLIPLPSQLIGPTAVATAFKRAQESLVFKPFEAQKDREKHPATPVSTAYRVLPRLWYKDLGNYFFFSLTGGRNSLLLNKEIDIGIVQKCKSYGAQSSILGLE